MTGQRVVILGEARIDEIRDQGGVRESVAGEAVELASELTRAAPAALTVTVIAPVGDDPPGERIRTVLHDRGIQLIALPAPEGTPRRALVRDRSGVQTERMPGRGAPAETRRSLAAQAEADVIVDLRDRDLRTLDEERDEVLRALGLVGAEAEPSGSELASETAPAPAGSAAPAESVPAQSAEPPAPRPAAAPARIEASPVLLPAPVVAGTVRHAPVRLVPEPPAVHEPVADWFGLEVRLARIAT